MAAEAPKELLSEEDKKQQQDLEASLTKLEQQKTDEWESKVKKQETFAHKTTVDVQQFEVEENIDNMIQETEQSIHEAEELEESKAAVAATPKELLTDQDKEQHNELDASLRKTGELKTTEFDDKLKKQETMVKTEAKVENFELADDLADYDVPVVDEEEKEAPAEAVQFDEPKELLTPEDREKHDELDASLKET